MLAFFPNPAARSDDDRQWIRTILANPIDLGPRLAYADWLDERQDPRAGLLRQIIAAMEGKTESFKLEVPEPLHEWASLMGAQIVQSVQGTKLEPFVAQALHIGRPAILIQTSKPSDSPLPVGTTKFGGQPDVPQGWDWPLYNGERLNFLGQFNLDELSMSPACEELPQSGLLSFFYAGDELAFEVEDFSNNPIRVLHFEDIDDLQRSTEEWAGLYPESAIHGFESFHFRRRDVPLDSEFEETLTSQDWDTIHEKESECKSNPNIKFGTHQLMGLPSPVQNDDMELSCLSQEHGMRYDDDRLKALQSDPAVNDWMMLAQFDSDDNLNWMWGDVGTVFFFIRKKDLRAGHFDRVRFEMQCC